ncbi:alpha-tectorin-like [Electrophorus electricus]|uniref:alpha-tectorin-like n=1 Tax=Electrophorus electricus TaxID=8005 RepID=UPI0015D03025|nr:alpha-tectorin-like [Electrophorus electricus]
MNGFVSFFEPPWEFYPISNINQDMIAPFWSDIENDEGGRIFYEQAKEGPLLAVATDAVKQAFPDTDFEEAVWVFVATWLQTPLELAPVDASFQVVLTADDDGRAYVLMNYGDIPSVQNIWVAGLAFNNFNFSSLPVQNSSDLPLISNVGFPGRWAFEVGFYDSCAAVQCTEDEVCVEKTGIYGCNCAEDNAWPNPDTFDAIKTCSGSSGTASFSRCQLFEAGYPAQFLHLNDYSCKGVVDGDRLVFHFDNDGHNCGTYLWNNETHFIYENMVQSLMGEGDQSVISHDGWLGIDISCVYPLIQSISMPMMIQADPSVVYRYLPTDGTYQIHMVPYPDASFSTPYSGEVVIEVNQQIFVGVEVVGVDNRQISIVLDRCWATPVADMNYNIYWNLIINECPNPEDGTVQVLQNGVATSSYFSFRMFTFTSRSPNIFLHCQVHLCLLENGNCLLPCDEDSEEEGSDNRRRRRSLDFHDTASISMRF